MAPVNVRIRRADGREEPLEMVYDGQDSRQMHVWVAAVPARLDLTERFEVLVDELPPYTALRLGQMSVEGRAR
jgi:hypothetical protein